MKKIKFLNLKQVRVRLFGEVYMSKDVTPYMHVLANHVPEALSEHGNLSLFCQQGLEKLNDNVTCWYFRTTSHINLDVFKKIMEKQNRIDFLKSKCKRGNAYEVICQNCNHSGHNKRSCQMLKIVQA